MHRGWKPLVLRPPSSTGRGLLFVDAAFDIDHFKVGLLHLVFGGRVFVRSSGVRTQPEDELDGIVKGIRFVVNVQWPVLRAVGDNAASLEQATRLVRLLASHTITDSSDDFFLPLLACSPLNILGMGATRSDPGGLLFLHY